MSSIGFRTQALASYALILLLLATGMGFAIRQLTALSAEQVRRVKAKEDEITHAERLRWSGEHLVSTGRGYLIVGDPELRAALERAEADFEAGVQTLALGDLTPGGAVLVREIERAAGAFRRVQDGVFDARERGEEAAQLAARFEADMLPIRRELAQALERLVAHKAAVIEEVYAEAEARRRLLTVSMYGMLAGLLLAGAMIARYFARLLERSHAETEGALQAANRALAARNELMGVVAHDLRNPLNVIAMKAALLRRAADSDKLRQQAESIENVTLRMENLIRTMLDVTTLEAGQFSVDPAACDVDELLRESLDMFLTLAASKHVRLESAGNAAGLEILADRERVLQVLSNLVGNALKFTPEGGEVKLSVEQEGDMARFGVLDTGPGIRLENLPHVFDRFWREKQKQGQKGTGLGLFIAKGIIDAHGGRLWVESEPGCGARFYFTLPIVKCGRQALLGTDLVLPTASPGAG